MTPIFIAIIRLILPISILRWPLAGSLAAMAADFIDFTIFQVYGWGFMEGAGMYQTYDKALDLYYQTFMLYVALSWDNKILRRTSFFLFAYRTIGNIIFTFTREPLVLVYFPNIFENFFIAILLLKKFNFKIRQESALRPVIYILLFSAVFKIIQELELHHSYFQGPSFLTRFLAQFFSNLGF